MQIVLVVSRCRCWSAQPAAVSLIISRGQPNQELCLSFGQHQSAAGSTGFAGLTFHISLT